MKFEQIKTNLTKTETLKLQLKGLLKDLTKALVIGLVGLVIAYVIGTHLDTLTFALTNPSDVRYEIQLNKAITEQSASVSAALKANAHVLPK